MTLTQEIYNKIRKGDRIHYKSQNWDFTATVANKRFNGQLSFRNYSPSYFNGRFNVEVYFGHWTNMTLLNSTTEDTNETFEAQNGTKINCSVKKL